MWRSRSGGRGALNDCRAGRTFLVSGTGKRRMLVPPVLFLFAAWAAQGGTLHGTPTQAGHSQRLLTRPDLMRSRTCCGGGCCGARLSLRGGVEITPPAGWDYGLDHVKDKPLHDKKDDVKFAPVPPSIFGKGFGKTENSFLVRLTEDHRPFFGDGFHKTASQAWERRSVSVSVNFYPKLHTSIPEP